MPQSTACQRCGATLAAFATEGFCSACMLEAAMGPPPASADSRASVASQRFGDYELTEEIARGGMGVVYRARQLSLNRIVALKMILTGRLASEVEVQRFREEARAAAALRHPNIIAIHEVGEIDGQPFFSMDLVEGRNLAEAVREGPFAPARAAACVRAVAEAIHYAHEHGILHRDLKPSNVLLDVEDRPHVTDFGLAKQLSNSERQTPNAELTVSGQLLGSPNFMPPEQAVGKRGELTAGSDVYSLGALLYHLLTGRPPFLADSVPATLRLLMETEPAPPRLLTPTVPRDLETICLKCLQKDGRRRYATARELADELGRFLRDEPIRARPLGRWERFHRWTRRQPIIAALTSVIGVLLITVAAISIVAAARLQQANRDGQAKLREAYLSQARANRWSGRPSRRFDSLDAIRKAAAIRPGPDLRNEAIAAMALVDLREVREWTVSRENHLRFDATYERYARYDTHGTIVVTQARDDAELLQIAGFGLPIQEIAFSPDGGRLGVHYREDKVYAFRVYDLRIPGKATLDLPGRWIRCFEFLPDNRRLAVVWATRVRAKSTSTVTFHDLVTGQELTSIPLPNLPFGVAVSPDSRQVAVGSPESSYVRIYSIADGQQLQTLGHSNGVYGIDWSRDGRRVAVACADHNAYVWDLTQAAAAATLLPHEGEAIWCRFTHRGDLLMSWGWNLVVKIWNIESRKELLRGPADSVGHFSADDRWLNVNRTSTSVALSEFADGRECRSYHFRSRFGGTHSVALAPDGRWMASGHRDGLRVWDLASGHHTHVPDATDTGNLRFTPDGHRLIACSGRELVSWPIRSVETNGTTRIELGPSAPLSREPPGPVEPAHRMVGVANGKAYLFDMGTFRVERRLTEPAGVRSAALSPDGRHCATWALNAVTVDIWDAANGSRVTSFSCPPSPCVGFSPDGRWLITGSAHEYIFWECASWQRRHSVPRGQTGGSHGKFAFSPDNKMVALAIGRGDVSLFDTTTFEPLATFESPEVNPVTGLDFSADGGRLAVSTTVQSIYVWDLRLIRRQLTELKLDFAAPALPPAASAGGPLEIAFLGLAPDEPASALPPLRFAPRDPGCTIDQIDLTGFYNAALTNSWFNPKWARNDLAALPAGLTILDGVRFDIRGIVQLAGSHPELAFPYPKEVGDIPIGRSCRVLHFLHANGWSTANGAGIGEYVVQYENGAERTIPITYAENIGSWWDSPGQTGSLKPKTTIAWRGRNPLSERSGNDLLLFHFRWENPRPDSAVASITFRSRMTPCAPFLVALSAE